MSICRMYQNFYPLKQHHIFLSILIYIVHCHGVPLCQSQKGVYELLCQSWNTECHVGIESINNLASFLSVSEVCQSWRELQCILLFLCALCRHTHTSKSNVLAPVPGRGTVGSSDERLVLLTSHHPMSKNQKSSNFSCVEWLKVTNPKQPGQ